MHAIHTRWAAVHSHKIFYDNEDTNSTMVSSAIRELLTIPRINSKSVVRLRPRRTSTESAIGRSTTSAVITISSNTVGTLAAFFLNPGLVIVGASFGVAVAKAGLRKLFHRGRRPRRSLTSMIDGNVVQFSVATFNLRGIMDRWGERQSLLKHCLRVEIDADVLCFQECMTGEYGQDTALLGPSYHVFPCKAALFNLMSSGNAWLHLYARSVLNMLAIGPIQRIMLSLPEAIESFRERFRLKGGFVRTLRDMTIAPFFGNSVATRLVNLHEITHSTLVLGDWRAAQRIEFELKDDKSEEKTNSGRDSPQSGLETTRFKIWVVNTHLDHEHPENRQRQALQVLEWMEPARANCAAVILCGDFNGNPDEPFHQLLKSKGYKSGYSMRHGREPEGTWPTGIDAPCKDEGPFECLDYVYVWAADDFSLKIVEAQVFGDRPDPKDPTLYPSDHAAIKITLRLEKLERSPELNSDASAEIGPLPPP